MKLTITVLSILVMMHADAQEYSIRGKIVDENNQPLSFGTVMLKYSTDSSLYKGEIADEAGEYFFQNLKSGNYFLEYRFTGYEIIIQNGITLNEGNANINLGNIKLLPASNEVMEVRVEGEKPFIERQADKMIVNIENSIIHTGSTVMEVFEKLPGVLVDQDGNIRLRGKQGVNIYIDGKPTTLSGQDLVNMLHGMSSANIQKIEIITNPSSKWDASGNSGILNIVMKKNRKDGYNGNTNINYGQGRYPKYGASASINFKKEKVNFFLNYSYSNRKGFNNLVIDRQFFYDGNLVERYLTNNYIRIGYKSHNPRLGIDYNFNDKTTVSILTSAFSNNFSPNTTNHSDVVGPGSEHLSTLDFSQDSKIKSFNYEFNTQINHRFDSLGQNLILNVDYGQYSNNSDQFFSTLQTDLVNPSANTIILTSDQKGKLYLYSIKADYSKPLKNDISLEAGAKSSIVKSDMDMRFYDMINASEIFDSTRSSHFYYTENINAAYISLQKKIRSLTIQAGLRAEQTLADGYQKLNGAGFDRNYFQVFPTIYLNYDFGKSNLNLNLGRRINRPAYEQMNPFRRLIDYTTYSEGNPYLLPELTYVSELSYSYDNAYFISLNYSHVSDNITDVLIQDAQTRTTIQSVVNLYQMNYFSIDLTLARRVFKWWKTNVNWTGYFSKFSGTIHNFAIHQGKPTFSVNCNNNFTISDNLSAELSGRYDHENLYGVTTILSRSGITAGLQQTVIQKRGTITINVSDIFWHSYPAGITKFGDVIEYWNSRRDTRVVNIGFIYNFGKGKTGRLRRNTGADEEKKRIG